MVQKRVCTSSKAIVEYEERRLSNGDYHLEEGKVQGYLIGALADEWSLSEEPILKGDPRFRWFAELDIDSDAARKTGKMLAAAFVHETSRAKDPDLHMHVLIANVTIDPERSEALAMSYGEMLEMRKTLDHRIQNNLARRLSALGYNVEVAEHGFRLREIPAAPRAGNGNVKET